MKQPQPNPSGLSRPDAGAPNIATAPIMAASIFSDILNVFRFFLLIFSSPSGV